MQYVIILLISFGIIGGCIAIGLSMNKKLVREGKIVNRDTDFAQYGSRFTSRVGSMQAVYEAVCYLDYDSIKANLRASSDGRLFRFQGRGYAAQMECTAFDPASGIAVYQFHFTGYQTNGSIPQNGLSMNKLLTAIEKMFLSFDANTGVQSYAVNFKTKHSFI